jgi:dATP pyrophosphohydrolase
MPPDTDFKRPESVLVVVYSRSGECLLLERAQPRGFWQSVTGSLAWGETAADCAAREVREETGLDPASLRDAHVERVFPIVAAWRARYAPDVETNVEHLFYLELPTPQPVQLARAEHVAYEWLPIGTAAAKVSSWTNREALERIARPTADP